MKAPEPRKCTKQLPHQRAAPMSRAIYYHGPRRNTKTLRTLNSKGNIGQIRQLQNYKLATDKTKA